DALQLGSTPASVFDEIAEARKAPALQSLGVVSMISASLVWRLAPTPSAAAAELIRRALAAGIDGFIFPDLPPEEGADLFATVQSAGLTTSLLIAPTTTPRRAEQLVKACTGFVYLLARAGITGETRGGAALPDIRPRVDALRKITDLPIACGFGISSAE